jgi:hypothetical protein
VQVISETRHYPATIDRKPGEKTGAQLEEDSCVIGRTAAAGAFGISPPFEKVYNSSQEQFKGSWSGLRRDCETVSTTVYAPLFHRSVPCLALNPNLIFEMGSILPERRMINDAD